MNVFIVLVISLFGTTLAASGGIVYDPNDEHGPSHWGGICESGTSQSPIDVDTSDVTYNDKLSSLKLTGYDAPHDLQCLNNGHTVKCNVLTATLPQVTMGELPGAFNLAQFHFHWGTNDGTGSEHFIDGKQYPLEVHMVHLNAKYSTVADVLANSDGGTVLGFFFEIGDTDNADWAPIFDNVEKVKHKDQTSNIAGVNIKSLLGDMTQFFRYSGGLTTPGCNEVITWNVFRKSIKISSSQMNKLRAVYKTADGDAHGDEIIGYNYRPVQPLSGRKVTFSQPMDTLNGSTTITWNTLLLLAALVVAKFTARV